MGTDLLKAEANERVDLADWQFGMEESIRENVRQIANQFLVSPTAQAWILDGFTINNPAGEQVRVVSGRALLGYRIGSDILNHVFSTDGASERIIDVSTFSNGTYGIYIRFEYLDSDSASRAFWNPSGAGSEFVQTIATRKQANWSLRIELTSPGDEWLKIGQVIVAASAISTAAGGLVDQRPFYFEGDRDSDIAPTTPVDNGTQFPSGWSTEGGGVANDRSADRELYGTKDLQASIAATRQCLEDIKGRGLRRWWDRDIGGMNIGFDADPVTDTLAVGDADFNFAIFGNHATISFDSAGGFSRVRYERTTNIMKWDLLGTNRMELTTTGLRVPQGVSVGHVTTPVDDILSVGDPDFNLNWNGGTPRLYFASDDYIENTPGGLLQFVMSGSMPQYLTPSGVVLPSGSGLMVGASAAPAPNQLNIGDNNFHLGLPASVPTINFALNDFMSFDRTTNELKTTMGSVEAMVLSPTKHAVVNIHTGQTEDEQVQPFTMIAFPGYTVPAGEITAGNVLRINSFGYISGFSTASAWEFALFYGSRQIAFTTLSSPAFGDIWAFEAIIRFKTATSATSTVFLRVWGNDDSTILPLGSPTWTDIDTLNPTLISAAARCVGGDASDKAISSGLIIDRNE